MVRMLTILSGLDLRRLLRMRLVATRTGGPVALSRECQPALETSRKSQTLGRALTRVLQGVATYGNGLGSLAMHKVVGSESHPL